MVIQRDLPRQNKTGVSPATLWLWGASGSITLDNTPDRGSPPVPRVMEFVVSLCSQITSRSLVERVTGGSRGHSSSCGIGEYGNQPNCEF